MMKRFNLLCAIPVLCCAVLCCDSFNPSFEQYLSDMDNEIKYPPSEGGTGVLKWDIRFPAGIVNADKTYFSISPIAGGADILKLSSVYWEDAVSTGSAAGSATLPSGTYFLRLHLGAVNSYAADSTVITIRKGKEFLYRGKGSGDNNAYTDNDFKVYALLSVSLQVNSGVPVTIRGATIMFYEDNACAGPPLSSTGGKIDVREIAATELGRRYESRGWTALESITDIYAKITVKDRNNRQFVRIKGPFNTSGGQSLSISIGEDDNDQLNLLVPVKVSDPIGEGSGSVTFGSVGSDGIYYGPQYGYGGAEYKQNVIVITAPGSDSTLDEIEIADWSPSDGESLEQGDTDSNNFIFPMPNSEVCIKTKFVGIPNYVKLETVKTSNSIQFGLYSSLEEAITVAVNENKHNVTITRDIKTESSGGFWSTGSENAIQITNEITLMSDGNYTIKRTGSFDGNFFIVNANGNFTITAGDEKKLTLDGGKNEGKSGAALVLVNTGGAFTMKNGAVLTNNKETSTGGAGVHIAGGAFNMEGGVIKNNHADGSSGNNGYGGGVYIGDGTAVMSGGVIKDNTAGGVGAGVYVESSKELTVKNNALIKDNDVYLKEGALVKVSGTLTAQPLVAQITPDSYISSDNKKLLTAEGSEADSLILDNYNKFSITPQSLTGGVTRSWTLSPVINGDNSGGYLSAPVITCMLKSGSVLRFSNPNSSNPVGIVTLNVVLSSGEPFSNFSASDVTVNVTKGGISTQLSVTNHTSNQISFNLAEAGYYQITISLKTDHYTVYSGDFYLQVN
jgi:hypothetical protein